ncbi:peptidoglycan-binding protein, partial [Microbacterium sp. AK009]|uniref:peptidoglycan-binding domain-containing protein n=1 Tax=Microbacterium sp. AK009 TaxID=2723068 RepID=UPI001C544852
MGIAAFAVGLVVRSPDASILEARDERIAVYSTVEMRSVTDAIRIQGETVGSSQENIFAAPPENAAFAVVTSAPVVPGSELRSGQLLASVSDRPIFVVFLNVPLFRDLRLNDVGTDVRALQEALGLSADGKVGADTMRAVRQLYVAAGFAPPGGDSPFIKMSEFQSLRPGPTVLQRVASVGTVLYPDVPLATVASGAPFVQVRATVTEADQIAAGASVTIQTTGSSPISGGPPPSFGPVAVRVVGFQLMGALPSVVDRCEV